MTHSIELLKVQNLRRHFTTSKGVLRRQRTVTRAVNGVSLQVGQGETLALVGESGCGKSTVASLLTGLIKPTEGQISWKGRDITDLKSSDRRALTRDIQIVFQNPYGSLNPKMSVFDIVAEPLQIHKIVSGPGLRMRVSELLRTVGLNEEHGRRRPHEFSGGQRQRIGIARALALNPQLLILDEPVSALDVSVQAQILNLLKELQSRLGLSYLFISHDLSVVRYMADRVAVMYLGQIVETGSKQAIFEAPLHPYTRTLLSAAPSVRRIGAPHSISEGEMPDPTRLPSGCSFRNRCPLAFDRCATSRPELVAAGPQTVRCFRYDDMAATRTTEAQ
jgi:oligopeptide/dipeptide ABC transporter ATP-binding protein